MTCQRSYCSVSSKDRNRLSSKVLRLRLLTGILCLCLFLASLSPPPTSTPTTRSVTIGFSSVFLGTVSNLTRQHPWLSPSVWIHSLGSFSKQHPEYILCLHKTWQFTVVKRVSHQFSVREEQHLSGKRWLELFSDGIA